MNPHVDPHLAKFELAAFQEAFGENVHLASEVLGAIAYECTAIGDLNAARFFQATRESIQAFSDGVFNESDHVLESLLRGSKGSGRIE